MSGHYRKEKVCLNCGHEIQVHYCSHCGQPNLELREPFWGFIAHSVGHYFHFDSKFFHTLVPLMTKPGKVTLDYLAGKRARYIHPISLYIFVSIIYFLVVPPALEKERKNPLAKEQEINEHLDSTNSKAIDSLSKTKLDQKDDKFEYWISTAVKDARAKNKENTLDHKFDVKEELKKYAPKQYFLLMPLLAFFIMLNFRKNRIYYIDHLVFTIHGMTAYFLIAIVSKPLVKYIFGFDSIFSQVIDIAVFAGVFWYLYQGLTTFYKRSRWVTIRKMMTLVILYSVSLLITREILKFVITYVLH